VTDSEEEEADEIVYKSKVLIATLREGEEIPPPKMKHHVNEGTLTKIRRSSRKLERPIRKKGENKTFVAMIEVNGQAVMALLDSGCMMDAVSPELVRITDPKVYELMEQVPVQLGTRGSQSKINYGTKTCIKYGHINVNHYFDIVNIDRYDAILGTVFMRNHRIILDFKWNKIGHGQKVLPALKEEPDTYLLVCRQAMHFKDKEMEGDSNRGTSHTKQKTE
jgi:hypothetical protein